MWQQQVKTGNHHLARHACQVIARVIVHPVPIIPKGKSAVGIALVQLQPAHKTGTVLADEPIGKIQLKTRLFGAARVYIIGSAVGVLAGYNGIVQIIIKHRGIQKGAFISILQPEARFIIPAIFGL